MLAVVMGGAISIGTRVICLDFNILQLSDSYPKQYGQSVYESIRYMTILLFWKYPFKLTSE